ncbi:MAG: DUF1015 family protein [Eubacteriales bacterium]|nr:DUF1015 family protein [Eubacteriales bacterium]
MAEIRPFRAVRPAAAYAQRIAALPYDVYDEAEARKEAAAEPLSFLCIDRAETQLPEGTSPYSDEVYQTAAALFEKEQEEGYYVQEETPCYYIYSLTMDGRIQTGLAACSAVSDYLGGICKKHENTVVKKEEDRIRHVRALAAQTGPIFLAYHKNEEISALIAEKMQEPALYDFTSADGIRHRVWKLAEPAVTARITELFEKKVPCTYIADGHHRAASAVKAALALREAADAKRGAEAENVSGPDAGRAHEYDYFLSVLFPDSELSIMDYNRVVKDLNGLTPEAFLGRAGESFEIEALSEKDVPNEKPKKKGEFHVYLAGSWYCFRLKAALSEARGQDAVKTLDVSALQELILEPLLGIKDPRTDERIEFVGGIRGIRILKEKADAYGGIAFSMHPTSIGELMSVADAGRLMPPKSTWFEPKLRSGLLIHKLYD